MLGCNAHSRWLSNSRAMTRWLALPPRSRNLMATISPVSVFSASWTKPEAPLRVGQSHISIWIEVRQYAGISVNVPKQSRTTDAAPCAIPMARRHGLPKDVRRCVRMIDSHVR